MGVGGGVGGVGGDGGDGGGALVEAARGAGVALRCPLRGGAVLEPQRLVVSRAVYRHAYVTARHARARVCV